MPIETRDSLGRLVARTELPEEARSRQAADGIVVVGALAIAALGAIFSFLLSLFQWLTSAVIILLQALYTLILTVLAIPFLPFLFLCAMVFDFVLEAGLPQTEAQTIVTLLFCSLISLLYFRFARLIYTVALVATWATCAFLFIDDKSDYVWGGFAGTVVAITSGVVLWLNRGAIDGFVSEVFQGVFSIRKRISSQKDHSCKLAFGSFGLLIFCVMPSFVACIILFSFTRDQFKFHTLFSIIAALLFVASYLALATWRSGSQFVFFTSIILVAAAAGVFGYSLSGVFLAGTFLGVMVAIGLFLAEWSIDLMRRW